MPDDTVTALAPDGHMAIVALEHEPSLDDLALMDALKSSAFYVRAIRSRLNQSRHKQRLTEHLGLIEERLARLHGPEGLNRGARTPPEIAVSVLAELTAVRNGHRVPEPVAVREASGWEWAAQGECCVGAGRVGGRPRRSGGCRPERWGAGAIGVSSSVFARRSGGAVLGPDPAFRRKSVRAAAAVRQGGGSPAQPWKYYHVVHR